MNINEKNLRNDISDVVQLNLCYLYLSEQNLDWIPLVPCLSGRCKTNCRRRCYAAVDYHGQATQQQRTMSIIH